MSEKQPKKKKTAGDVVLTVVLIAAICVFCYAGYNLFHTETFQRLLKVEENPNNNVLAEFGIGMNDKGYKVP